MVKNSNIWPVNKLAQKYCSANTHHESWTIIEDCLINYGRMIYVKEDHIYEVPSCYNSCSLKRDSHNKTVTESTSVLRASVGEILNQSRSIAKRLVECVPTCHWTIAVISCDQVKLWRTSCVCEASFRPNAIRSQCVSMNRNCMYHMLIVQFHAGHWYLPHTYMLT